MKKRLLSLAVALILCLSFFPQTVPAANEPPSLTRAVEGLTMTFEDPEPMNRITVNEVDKRILFGPMYPPSYFSMTVTGDGSGPSPYHFSLNDVDLTLNNVSLRPSYLDQSPLSIMDRSLTLQGKNTVCTSGHMADFQLNFSGITIKGNGSLDVEELGFEMKNSRMDGGSLSSSVSGITEQRNHPTGLVVFSEFIMDGGSLTLTQGDYACYEDANMLQAPPSPIILYAPTVINGGQVFVESGTDLRTGRAIPCISCQTYWNSTGSITINGGVFNVGDLDANTVLGVPVGPGCQVVQNQDPDTGEKYPFLVQQSTEQLAVYPRNADALLGKTLQLQAVGTAADKVSWTLKGSQNPGTSISETGLLTVAADETAKSLTVTASADGSSVSTPVSVKPEVFDIWMLVRLGSYTVLEHRQLEKGTPFTLPLVDTVPGFKHTGWYDSSDPYEYHDFNIGQTLIADHDEVYVTYLEEDESSFAIGGRQYKMPPVGGCVNSSGGTTRTGDWWMELPQAGRPELTLNGADLSEADSPSFSVRADQVIIPAKDKLTIHVQGENTILPPKGQAEASVFPRCLSTVLGTSGTQVIIDLEEGSSLTVQGRPGQRSVLLDFNQSPLTLQGSGKLRLVPKSARDYLIEEYYVNVSIRDSAVLEYDTTGVAGNPEHQFFPIQKTAMYDRGTLLFRCGNLPMSFRGKTNDITLPADGSMHITAGLSPDGQNTRTLTRDELAEQLPCLRYIKIGPDPVPPHVPSYPLWLGGVQVTEQNKANILGDGSAAYDPASATLTLKDAHVTAPGGQTYAKFSGLTATGARLTIHNSGNSVFTGAAGGLYSFGLFLDHPGDALDLRLEGEGTLHFAGGPQAKSSQGALSDTVSMTIDGSVMTELVAETGFSISSCLWDELKKNPTTAVFYSESLSGSNPALWDKVDPPLDIPYIIFYRPTPSRLEMQYLLKNDSWTDLRYLVPIIGLSDSTSPAEIGLRPKAFDQLNYLMDTGPIIDQFVWSVSGEMSSANLEENMNSWGRKNIAVTSGQQASIRISKGLQPCYIGLELTHAPTGAKLALPAFLVSGQPISHLTAEVKPEYADKVYRDGENFDRNSITVTRVYPDVSSDRHPEAFQCDTYTLDNDAEMNEGQNSITIHYLERNMDAQIFNRYTSVPITVLGPSSMAEDPGGVLVTSSTAATLVIATYDSSGRMTDIKTYSIPAHTEDRLFSLKAGQKAFLLEESSRPLCPPVSKP